MSEEQVKILPTDGFVRQKDNPGAIINVDKNGLQAYKLRREAEKRKESDINTLKNEMSEIKNLLTQLLEKK